jgi:hypothetical protein
MVYECILEWYLYDVKHNTCTSTTFTNLQHVVLYVPGITHRQKKYVASRHLKGSRKLQGFDFNFTGGFASGFGSTFGSTTGTGSTGIMAVNGTGTSTGGGLFNVTTGSSGFISTPFAVAGSSSSGGFDRRPEIVVNGDVGTAVQWYFHCQQSWRLWCRF